MPVTTACAPQSDTGELPAPSATTNQARSGEVPVTTASWHGRFLARWAKPTTASAWPSQLPAMLEPTTLTSPVFEFDI